MREQQPNVRCLILTSYGDGEAIFAAVVAGAAGYVLTQIRGSNLIDAVRQVAAGQSLLDPSVTDRVLRRIREGKQEDAPSPPTSKTATASDQLALRHVIASRTAQ